MYMDDVLKGLYSRSAHSIDTTRNPYCLLQKRVDKRKKKNDATLLSTVYVFARPKGYIAFWD
jgi:hypothetical protein